MNSTWGFSLFHTEAHLALSHWCVIHPALSMATELQTGILPTSAAVGALNDCPGLPWCLCGEEATCLCRRHRFRSQSHIPQATEQHGPWTTIISACALELGNRSHWFPEVASPTSCRCWAASPGVRAPQQEMPPQRAACPPQRRGACALGD